MLVTILAKVKIWSESSMEVIGGPEESKGAWKKKMMSMYAEDIVRLIRYDTTKCIIVDQWGENIMVYEPFDKVMEKWKKGLEEAKKEFKEPVEQEEPEEEENNEEEE